MRCIQVHQIVKMRVRLPSRGKIVNESPEVRPVWGSYKLFSTAAALHGRRQRRRGKGWPGSSAVAAL